MLTPSRPRTGRLGFALAAAATLVTSALGVVPVPAHASTRPGYDGRITFDSVRADGSSAVYTMNADGTDLKRVPISALQVGYSPQFPFFDDSLLYVGNDGTRANAYLRWADGSSEEIALGFIDPDNHQCTQVSQPTIGGSVASPFAVFTCSATSGGTSGHENNLWRTLPGNLAAVTELTTSAATEDHEDGASISPDGTRVVFHSFFHHTTVNLNSGFRLETVNADGTGRAVLTTAPSGGGVYDPEWSPDGKWILFEQATSASDNATNELYLMHAAGGAKTRLTTDNVAELHPTWSPDGRKILFSMVSTACSCVTLATMKPTPTDVPHPIGNSSIWNSGNWNNFNPHWQALADTTPPTRPTVTGAPVFTLGGITLHFSSSTDAGSGLAGYQVRSSRAAWNSSTWTTWSSWVRPSSTSWTSPALVAGSTTCFQVAARDNSGNLSTTAIACSSRPAQESAATYTGSWTHVTSTSYYGGAANKAASKGASLSLRSFHGDRVGLLVRTCSACGAVKVYVGGVLYGTLNTYSATTHTKVWRTLPRFATTSGTVKIVTTSSKPVYVDGIGLSKR